MSPITPEVDVSERGVSTRPSDRHLPAIQPLTARSVVLSTLLGYHPPALSSRALVRVGGLFDVAEATVRVALTRMTADGELIAENGVYRLSERLLRRQEQQEEARAPRTVPWPGTWEQAVVFGGPARPVAERTAQRRLMLGLRLAELREGVWLRPANLARSLDDSVDHCTILSSTHQRPRELAHALWDLRSWADDARRLIDDLDGADTLKAGFLVIAETLRHLQIDPYLPEELLPADWPGPDLRGRYTAFRTTYAARLRAYSTED